VIYMETPMRKPTHETAKEVNNDKPVEVHATLLISITSRESTQSSLSLSIGLSSREVRVIERPYRTMLIPLFK
jgi:hypothetical protein